MTRKTHVSLQCLLIVSRPQLSIGTVTVIAEIPFYKLLQSRVEVRDRFVVELQFGGRDVGVREWDVAVARHFDGLTLGFHFEVFLEDVDECRDGDWGCVAQVENAQHGRTGLLAAAACALLGCVQRGNASLHDVVDVGEIASKVFASRARVDADRLSLQDVAGEGEVRHVGSPPWPVDGEEPESRDRETVDVVVCMSDLFSCFLCSCVQARGLICSIGLGEGYLQAKRKES